MRGSEPAKISWPERPSEADERRLISAAQEDPARFGEIYESYFEVVYAYAAKRGGDRAAAEDLTSEVFRKALASLPRFKWTGAPFGAWLLRIAANLIADRARRDSREGTEAELSGAESLESRSVESEPESQQQQLEHA